MELNQNGDTIVLNGNLTEDFPKDSFVQMVNDLQAKGNQVTLNFDQVQRANSVGIAGFLKGIAKIGQTIDLKNCPVWLVEQFNEISELTEEKICVKSVFAPYLDEASGLPRNFLIDIVSDFFNSDVYASIEERIDERGTRFTADFDKEDYFAFLQSANGR